MDVRRFPLRPRELKDAGNTTPLIEVSLLKSRYKSLKDEGKLTPLIEVRRLPSRSSRVAPHSSNDPNGTAEIPDSRDGEKEEQEEEEGRSGRSESSIPILKKVSALVLYFFPTFFLEEGKSGVGRSDTSIPISRYQFSKSQCSSTCTI